MLREALVQFAGMAGAFALTALLTWALFQTGSRSAHVEGEAAVLLHGWGVTALGLACVALGAPMLAVPLLDPSEFEPAWALVLVAVVGAAFLVAGVWFVVAGRREWVRVTADGIAGQSGLRGGPTRLAWSEVEAVTFSRRSGYLTLEGSGGRRVRVSALLHGASGLADLVGRRLDAPGAAEAVRQFGEYRSAYGLG